MSRFFPSERRDRWVALVAASAVVLGAAASPLAFADDLKDKQRKIDRQVEAAHDDLNESSAALRKATIRLRNAQAELAAARGTLASTRQRLAAAKARDVEMQAKLVEAEEKLDLARAELQQGREDVRRQRAAVDKMFATQYEQFDPRLEGFAALLKAEDLADVGIVQEATRSALIEQDGVLSEFRETAEMLAIRKDEVTTMRDAVETQRQAAAANLVRVTKLEKRALAQTRTVTLMVSKRRAAAGDAQTLRQRDRKALVALEADQARIAKILRNRAAKHQGTPSNTGGYLNYPVNGYVTSPYGYRIHPIYGYRSLHNGVDFGAGCGTPMYAAADGTVLSRYYQDAWGNRLVIDNGGARGVGLATIYNHASKYVVSPGQRVKRGQLVGYVGTTGWSTGCHLHFIVMANGTAVDPMKWF